jgi:DNA segregation ATPase FtsK/SpoIIIE, S-DNA-T family
VALKRRNSKKSETSTASTSKKKKSQPGWLKNISTFLADTRVKKIIGISFTAIAIFIFLSCVSYIFTGNHDLRLIQDDTAAANFAENEAYSNVTGKAGAHVAWFFMHRFFGLAALLIPFLLFLFGVRIWLKKYLLPIGRTTRLSLFGLFFIPLCIGFLAHDRVPGMEHTIDITCNENLVGGYGHFATEWATYTFGGLGTFMLILLIVAVAVIFNLAQPLAWLQEKMNAMLKADEKLEADSEDDDEVEMPSNRFRLDDDDNELEDEDSEAADNVLDEMIGEEDSFQLDVDDVIEDESESPFKSESEEVEDENDDGLNIEINAFKEENELSEAELDGKVQEFGEYDPKLDLGRYELPSIDFLETHGTGAVSIDKDELEGNKNRIVETLNNYKIEISKIKATIGPTVTLYEIVPAPGVRISKIKNLEDDIALSLSALGIRIIAPIPGKGTIGIEVPNSKPSVVSMRSLIASDKFQNADMALPIALGKTISNETLVADLSKMPHLLMAGATGQGKSVGLNAILVSLLYKLHPAQLKFVLVDPKKVELTLFNKIERHYLAKLPEDGDAIITDTSKVVKTLNSLCIEMDDRYELLKTAHCRNLKEYNAKFIKRRLNPENGHRYLPYIILVVDEFADLIMTAGKEVETPIARLAQLARAIGIHLIIATQRPSVNIITGTIKANFPARIAFRVTSKIDSRTILDSGGAEQLIGRGDMLFSTGNDLIRLQCGFVDTPEVENICDFIGAQQGYASAFLLPEYIDENASEIGNIAEEDRDELFYEAATVVVMHQQGSASLLQRKLKLGYNRAGRIVDQLEAAGIIGPFKGSKAREVLIPDEMTLEQLLKSEQQEQ